MLIISSSRIRTSSICRNRNIKHITTRSSTNALIILPINRSLSNIMGITTMRSITTIKPD